MGTLLRSCAEVRTAIKLSFGVVSGVTGVDPGIDVLDGGPRASGEGAVWWIFRHLHPIGLNGRNDVKLTIFPYGQYILGIYVSLAF